MRRLAVVVAILALSRSAVPARAASIRGTLLAGDSKAALAGVEVVLRRAADSTVVAHAVTGADGRFRADSLGLERHLLRASLLGYQPLLLDVEPTAAAPDLDLGARTLAVSPIALPGVTATTERATAIIAPDRNLYLTKDMPVATTGTATDVLRAVPELDVDIEGRVSLRGSSSVNLQFNGRAAPMKGEALTTYLRQMPASRIERIEVIANPSAKFDPEGTAGIVNLVLKDNVGLGLSGSVNLSAGQRYDSAGGRVAWQSGPLTVFGGLSGSLYRWLYNSNTFRRSLGTTPPGSQSWSVDNQYEGRYGLADASADLALNKRVTLYGTVNTSLGGSDPFARTRYALADSTPVVSRSYERSDDGDWSNASASFTLGLQHVVQKGRNEREIEFLENGNHGDSDNLGLDRTDLPAGTADQTWVQNGAYGYRERALQIDDVQPVGAKGKVELGYRGTERRSTSSTQLAFFEGDSVVATPVSGRGDYEHRERFHSGYLTGGVTVGRLSVQLGARAEAAYTTFDVRSSARRFDRDYRSLFPSANLAWDFGQGRVVRGSFSRRIERPAPYYLDPDVRSSDSLNRYVGNPALGPRYTNAWGIDASWTGSRGSLRVSPYFRETVDNWDLVTTVDAGGVATSTYRNASSVQALGVTFTASLRQTGRFGGTASLGLSHDHHDASNLTGIVHPDVTGWNANGNVTFKATPILDLQAYLRYSPARVLAQGRASAYTAVNLSSRIKLGEKAWLSLSVNDPFDMAHYSSTTGDATYSQVSRSDNRMRSASAGLTWTWGKPPEQKERRQSADAPANQDAQGGPR